MVHPIFELTEWLERQKGQTLMIYKSEFSTGKEEIIDRDEVKLVLNDVSVRDIERHDEDDYLANQEIILHGEGQIHTDRGQQELPQSVYEIPIYDDFATQDRENGIRVETEKAIYTILPQ
ncbi:hypothetical protein J2S74_001351 [Evansella vedderi]|uniref:Uncharacterized protein n=1 Tax=Evansella vedderi TaxID=38282 RepID=A0ABT9ZRX2_9BACI|nr:hypothetical protein [Evansella vedderi]MDQ0253978.1 hypothetical protein [Evansella vedderi]